MQDHENSLRIRLESSAPSCRCPCSRQNDPVAAGNAGNLDSFAEAVYAVAAEESEADEEVAAVVWDVDKGREPFNTCQR